MSGRCWYHGRGRLEGDVGRGGVQDLTELRVLVGQLGMGCGCRGPTSAVRPWEDNSVWSKDVPLSP